MSGEFGIGRQAMRRFDVFNGDADGLCALHQLRLAEPADAELVTGVKRDIQLLRRVSAQAGDRVTVLDISFDSNRAAALDLLERGARLAYFDHHFAGELPRHPNLAAHIDTAPEICTALIVDRVLEGRYRAWAIVAAFGDGLTEVGRRLAREHGLAADSTAVLARLGECLNYNAYGETVADLHFDPAELFGAMRGCGDPLEFAAASPVFRELEEGYRADMARTADLQPLRATPEAAVFVLPDAPWARRVIGVYANRLAGENRDRAHAILNEHGRGGFTVSVRAPKSRPVGADELCRQFETGGGRKAAAGINDLPEDGYDAFVEAFLAQFGPAP